MEYVADSLRFFFLGGQACDYFRYLRPAKNLKTYFVMKKMIVALCALLVSLGAFAQNDKADNIVGIYRHNNGKDDCKIQIVKLDDGTYQGAVCWMDHLYDDKGKVRTDVKNPDKSLRSVPLDKVVIFSGLQYDAGKKQWSGTKIYDPGRGIRVKMTAKFEKPGTLIVRGTVLGIGESVTWVKQD